MRIERGAEIDDHRRAEGRGRELVRAGPLGANPCAGAGVGDEGGVGGRVVGAVVAVAAGAVTMADGDGFGIEAEGAGECAAQQAHPLRVGEDLECTPSKRARPTEGAIEPWAR